MSHNVWADGVWADGVWQDGVWVEHASAEVPIGIDVAFGAGNWLILCDRCGFKRRRDQVVRTWNNLMVCAPSTGKHCFETRHPQEFVRAKPDIPVNVPFEGGERAVSRVVNVIPSTVGVQENTIPQGHFTNNNKTLTG